MANRQSIAVALAKQQHKMVGIEIGMYFVTNRKNNIYEGAHKRKEKRDENVVDWRNRGRSGRRSRRIVPAIEQCLF